MHLNIAPVCAKKKDAEQESETAGLTEVDECSLVFYKSTQFFLYRI